MIVTDKTMKFGNYY